MGIGVLHLWITTIPSEESVPSIVFRSKLKIGRRTAIGDVSPESRVTTEKKKQKALKTQCFKALFILVGRKMANYEKTMKKENEPH